MTITAMKWRVRNDFRATFKCENCGNEGDARGYSDSYFYGTVMPNAICPKCGKNRHEETEEELKARTGRSFHLDWYRSKE